MFSNTNRFIELTIQGIIVLINSYNWMFRKHTATRSDKATEKIVTVRVNYFQLISQITKVQFTPDLKENESNNDSYLFVYFY